MVMKQLRNPVPGFMLPPDAHRLAQMVLGQVFAEVQTNHRTGWEQYGHL